MSLYDSAYRCKWLFMKSIHSSIRSVPKAVISDLFRDVRNASHHERESRDMIQRSDYFPTLYRFLTFVHWHSLCKICFLCLKDIDTLSDHQQRWCSVPRALIKCPFLLFLRLPVCFLFVFVFFSGGLPSSLCLSWLLQELIRIGQTESRVSFLWALATTPTTSVITKASAMMATAQYHYH